MKQEMFEWFTKKPTHKVRICNYNAITCNFAKQRIELSVAEYFI